MKNILNYIKENMADSNYVVAVEPYYEKDVFKYKELKMKSINKFANYLKKNISTNKKIGIYMENCNGFINAFYSIIINNKIAVSINNNVEIDELNDIIKKNRLDTIITNSENIEKLSKINIKNIINIDDLTYLEENETLDFESENKKMQDVLVVSYTSGTSGSFSKGVELTYKNITFVSLEYKKVYKLNVESKIITVLPLWHNYAMFACLTSSIVAKSTLVIMKKWDAKLFIDINKMIKPSIFPGSPYMYIDLINNHPDELTKLDNLKVCDSGGDSLPIECINRFENLTGAIITEGYGLTETASLTHFNYSAGQRRVGSLGKTVSNTKCKILDLDGNELPTGEWGLLWIKGPMVFKNYVGLKKEVNKVKKTGWFNTNDVVKCDEDGYYYIAGRFSDLKSINTNDNQLRDLENSLYKFEGISRVHVKVNYNSIANFNYFDIFVILKQGYKIQELYDYINCNLKQYIIGEIKIVDKLPTTGTGKIKRNKIKELLSIDLNDYEKTELSGGLRCKTFLLKKEEKYIYQEYYENTMYQAKKKYDITNLILNNTNINFIPKAISYGTEENKTWLITEYKSGKMLNDIRKDKDFSLNLVSKDIAKTLKSIHSISNDKYGWITDNSIYGHDNLTDYLNSELDRFVSAVKNEIDENSIEIMLDKAKEAIDIISKEESRLKPQLLWFDLNPNNILIDNQNGSYKLSAIIDAGGAKYGIKEWDLAFLRMETCINEDEFQSILTEYKKIDKNVDEKLIKALCVFIELDDMIIRILDKINLPTPYDSEFKEIIANLEKKQDI